jgi:hypothetical protein
MNNPVDAMTIEELAEVRGHIRAIIDSGVLEPFDIKRMWDVIDDLDGRVKALRKAETPPVTGGAK